MKKRTNSSKLENSRYDFARDILNTSYNKQKKEIEKLSNKEFLEVLKYLDHDEVTDLIQLRRNGQELLKKLEKETQEKVNFLLKFNPETAAGMMSLNYLIVKKEDTFKDIITYIKKHEQRTGKFPEILVEHKDSLLGEIQGHKLSLKSKNTKAFKEVTNVATLHYNASKKEIINTFKKHRHDKVVVTDEQNRVLGLLYSDDILKIIHEESTKNIYSLGGVQEEENVNDGPFLKVKNRASWLIIHLLTAFIAVWVISFFESTIESLVLLAFYMPVVAGMGGNAGTQTMAVIVRGIALKEISFKNSLKPIINETIAGAINGLINGILVAIVAILWNKSPLLGLILFLAMVINLMLAGIFGAITPLILKKFGKDPASSAVTFITAATDIFGFFVFLGLATILL
ncbi:MAG: magnesium transporter [Candidatus Woesearchaeota archaeon]